MRVERMKRKMKERKNDQEEFKFTREIVQRETRFTSEIYKRETRFTREKQILP